MAIIASNPLSLGTESSKSSHTIFRSPEMPKRFPGRSCNVVSFSPAGPGRWHKWLGSPIISRSTQLFAEGQDDSRGLER